MYPQSMFWIKSQENIKIFLIKFSIFTCEKNLNILNGQVCIMNTDRGRSRISGRGVQIHQEGVRFQHFT